MRRFMLAAFAITFSVAVILAGLKIGSSSHLNTSNGTEPTSTTAPSLPTKSPVPIVLTELTSPVPAGPLLGVDGQSIILFPPDPGYVPRTSADEAALEAWNHADVSAESPPSKITEFLAQFGKGDAVWVVTFDGICVSVSGGAPDQETPDCAIQSESAIVNDPTGLWSLNYWGEPSEPS